MQARVEAKQESGPRTGWRAWGRGAPARSLLGREAPWSCRACEPPSIVLKAGDSCSLILSPGLRSVSKMQVRSCPPPLRSSRLRTPHVCAEKSQRPYSGLGGPGQSPFAHEVLEHACLQRSSPR